MKNPYPNLQAIHCFSTGPFREGRGLSGSPCSDKAEFSMPDYLLGTMILSALQWRRLNGPITLFTDRCFYEYLLRRNLLDCWDDIRVVLDDLTDKIPNLRQSVFWAACKMYCYQLMKTPFVCIDTDLVVRETLIFPEDADLVAAHGEIIRSSSYGDEKDLKFDSDYLLQKCPIEIGLNMSVCYFRSEAFKRRFVSEAFRIMKHSLAEYDGRYALPELLYMEQVKPVQIAHSHGYRIKCLMDCVWSPNLGRFTQIDERYGYWIFFELIDTKAPVMHLWFHKNWLDQNAEARRTYMDKLNSFISAHYPDAFEKLSAPY